MKKNWRVNTPLLLQMQTIECGAASLGIILGYYGKYLTLAELREKCSISRDGSNTFDILQAAAHYGLEGEGYQKEMEELEELNAPAILFWDYTHFLVLEGFSETMVYLNDPAYGHYAVSREEFKNHYSGIVLTFKKGVAFQQSIYQPGLLQKLQSIWKGRGSSLFFFFAASMLVLFATLTVPITFRIFIDHHYSNVTGWKLQWLGIILFILLFGVTLSRFYLTLLKKIASKVSVHYASMFVWKMLRLPLSYFQQRDPREIAGRVELSRTISQYIIKEAFPAAIQFFLSIIYAWLMFEYDAIVASVTLFGAIGSLVILYYVDRAERPLMALASKDANFSESVAFTALHAIESIKIVGAETPYFEKWAGLYTRAINGSQRAGKRERLITLFPFFIQLFSSALLLGTGGEEVVNGNLTLGMLVALQILLMFFIAPFKNFIKTYQNFKHLQRNLGRLEDVGQAEIDRAFEKKETMKPRLTGNIEFKDVTFGYYPFAAPYFDKISFHIKPGKWIGITGLISSGKSTLGKLAAALLYPWKGEILYDGYQWNEIEENYFRESIGWISQDSFVFAGSLRENITLWDTSITDSELEEVCRLVGIQIPKDCWISEDGKNLSYSEKQQIEIARIFLKKPSLLVIDEGLNTLTLPLQKQILGYLKELKCTTIFITYQQSVLDACDEVIMMEQGRMRR